MFTFFFLSTKKRMKAVSHNSTVFIMGRREIKERILL
jgi:hypothetical protein